MNTFKVTTWFETDDDHDTYLRTFIVVAKDGDEARDTIIDAKPYGETQTGCYEVVPCTLRQWYEVI